MIIIFIKIPFLIENIISAQQNYPFTPIKKLLTFTANEWSKWALINTSWFRKDHVQRVNPKKRKWPNSTPHRAALVINTCSHSRSRRRMWWRLISRQQWRICEKKTDSPPKKNIIKEKTYDYVLQQNLVTHYSKYHNIRLCKLKKRMRMWSLL